MKEIVIADLIFVPLQVKEAALLFFYTFLAKNVNDAADDALTDVFLWKSANEHRPSHQKTTAHDLGFEDFTRLTLSDHVDEWVEEEQEDAKLTELEQVKKELTQFKEDFRHQLRYRTTQIETLKREQVRVDLILEGTSHAFMAFRKEEDQNLNRVVSKKNGPIAFPVLGIRWTSKYFLRLVSAASLSLIIGLVRYITQIYSLRVAR